jgi:hypothetical protein
VDRRNKTHAESALRPADFAVAAGADPLRENVTEIKRHQFRFRSSVAFFKAGRFLQLSAAAPAR